MNTLKTAREYKDLTTQTIMSEFKLAIVDAVMSTFLEVDAILFYLHFEQLIYQHAQEFGLRVACNDAADLRISDFSHILGDLA